MGRPNWVEGMAISSLWRGCQSELAAQHLYSRRTVLWWMLSCNERVLQGTLWEYRIKTASSMVFAGGIMRLITRDQQFLDLPHLQYPAFWVHSKALSLLNSAKGKVAEKMFRFSRRGLTVTLIMLSTNLRKISIPYRFRQSFGHVAEFLWAFAFSVIFSMTIQ